MAFAEDSCLPQRLRHTAIQGFFGSSSVAEMTSIARRFETHETGNRATAYSHHA
jgi:hypothetical protein